MFCQCPLTLPINTTFANATVPCTGQTQELANLARCLTRLGTRTINLHKEDHLSCGLETACDAILAGYEQSLQAGLGSLGRRRFTALAEWRGGMIAREAKELRLSAWHWEREGMRCLTPDLSPPSAERGTTKTDKGGKQDRGSAIEDRLSFAEVIRKAVRVAHPFSAIHGHWLIRRLAPDCSRVELESLLNVKDELKLLHAMGWETANVHLRTHNRSSGPEARPV
jgi:hypothetical protein